MKELLKNEKYLFDQFNSLQDEYQVVKLKYEKSLELAEIDRKVKDDLLSELEKFNPELLVKQRIVAISKADMLDDELKDEIRKQMKGMEVMFFSSVTEQGVGELIDVLWATVSADV